MIKKTSTPVCRPARVRTLSAAQLTTVNGGYVEQDQVMVIIIRPPQSGK